MPAGTERMEEFEAEFVFFHFLLLKILLLKSMLEILFYWTIFRMGLLNSAKRLIKRFIFSNLTLEENLQPFWNMFSHIWVNFKKEVKRFLDTGSRIALFDSIHH